jgi:hypothetical protein
MLRVTLLTFIRAVAWFAVVVLFWSLNIRWGTDLDVNAGPPGQWERHVVGAGLLAAVAALALSVSGRRGNPPSWLARGVAFGAAALILTIGLLLRREAQSAITGADLIAGAGWTWMMAGGGFALSAAILALTLKPAARPPKRAGEPAADRGTSPRRRKGGR